MNLTGVSQIRGLIRAAFWLSLFSMALAERLPVRQYTIADGLAQGSVWAIHQDARGFHWLATSDGLSRFDGYRFTNYGVKDGLGYAVIRDTVSDQQGRLWVATAEGVSLLLNETEAMQQGKKFKNYLLATGKGAEDINDVNRIVFDAENRLWCVTTVGLYRAKSLTVAAEQFELVSTFYTGNTPAQKLLDRRGRLWVSGNSDLRCIEGGNLAAHQPWVDLSETTNDPFSRLIQGLAELADGRVVVATKRDLYEFIEPSTTMPHGTWRKLPLALPPSIVIGTIYPNTAGGLWIGTDGGLIRYRDGQQVTYRLGSDPNPYNIQAFHSDSEGNLWIGVRQRGLLKLRGEGVTVYDARDGLVPVMDIYGWRATHDGRMTLSGRPFSAYACNETYLTSNRFESTGELTHLRLPSTLCAHDVFQDSHKNWWVLRFLPDRKIHRLVFIPGPELNFSAGYELTTADGWVDDSARYNVLYEDSAGTIWLRNSNQIFRVEYQSNGHPRIVEGVKGKIDGGSLRFIRFPSGTLWWSNGATLSRHQQGQTTTIALPVEKARLRVFYADRKGRLWIGTIEHGVFMTDARDSDPPRFVNFTTAHGLAHNQVEGICEDDDGNLWFGTVRGLCRRDEQTGRFNLFSFGENSLGAAVRDLHKDERGNLWASLIGAVVRVNPRLLARPAPPLPVYLLRVSIAGEPLVLGETGVVTVAPLELAAGRNNLEIEFVSPNFRDENSVQYQYKLDGVDADWTAPDNVREVNYARLAPGSYTFWVRAVGENGIVSSAASLPFVILRPLWQRWWVLSLLTLMIGGLVYGAYRYRVAQLLALERVRLRIASDLHDDVGANLSLIAGVSEMLAQQPQQPAPQMQSQLTLLAESARRSMDAMSDIVWMISPNRDHLRDLVQRLRRFATETLTPRQIEVKFVLPDSETDIPIAAESRREIFLIGKEAINNIARHAACTEVEIALTLHGTLLLLRLCDNGKGFDLTVTNGGNGNGGGQGLLSMRSRAAKLGGELIVTSQPGSGTEIVLRAPIGT